VARTPVVAAVAVCCLVALAASAGADPTVFVWPETKYVDPGETFTMDVRVDGGADTVTCFLVEFQFDPAVIDLVSADEGSLFVYCGFPTMYNWDVMGLGHHSCNDVTLGPYTYTLPPGELVSLEFVAGESGSTPIEILYVDLRDYRRQRILPVWTENGTVIIGQQSGVEEEPDVSAQTLALGLHPNPFSGTVRIEFAPPPGDDDRGGPERALPRGAPAVVVYDVRGRLVVPLSPERAGDGWLADWDGCDGSGSRCGAGIYFIEFAWEEYSIRRPVVCVH